MTKKQKLELTWIGKDERPKLEPRILIEDAEKSYGDKHSGNMLIYGDNLLALKALEQEYSGKIKCVFIDPPYNTGSAFTHYDDGLEHSIWLSLMRDRLEIIRNLLAVDGSLWITIDDNEVHYLKVLCDEVLGRREFIANLVWQSKDTPGNNSVGLAQTHNHILAYRKTDIFRPNLLMRSEKQIATYKNPDNDPNGPWLGTPLTRAEHRDRDYYALHNKAGREVWPPKGSSWRRPPDKLKQLEAEGRIYWGKDGNAEFPMEKKYISEVKDGVVNQTWWPYDFAGSTRNASAELKGVFGGEKAFDTPKPEKLLYRILELASNPGDLILDSFAGSGTTGAVAQKMGRRWIMVELGEHCHTHIIPRMKKVIDGEDSAGITKATNWHGGGGFKYYFLAPSLLKQDKYGNWVIDERYNADMLAAAMAKQEGFRYAPDPEIYWKQGQSTEKDYIFTTTTMVTVQFLDRIHEELRPDESLLICCKSFQHACETKYPNITIKKIPKLLLGRCEFGREDYSLNVTNLPAEDSDDAADEHDAPAKSLRKKAKKAKAPSLFGEGEEL